MNVSVRVLLIVSLAFKGGEAFQLKCDFRLESTECKVISLKVSEGEMDVTSISGVLEERKTLKDVEEIWIDRSVETEIVPANLCKFFDNLLRIDIYGQQINSITRRAFQNCTKVIKVCILFTALHVLPNDLFYDLEELKELFLYENKLVILPENLIEMNLKLKTFSARNNVLSFIDIDFNPTVESIDLRTNKCIDKRFPEDVKNLTNFMKEISKKCENPLRKLVTEKDSKILKLEEAMESLSANNSILLLENTDLKIENNEYLIEINATKTSNTKIITATFGENILLRKNITSCQRDSDRKSKQIDVLKTSNDEFVAKIKRSQTVISELNTNLSSSTQEIAFQRVNLDILMNQNTELNVTLDHCRKNYSSINENYKAEVFSLENTITELVDSCNKSSTNNNPDPDQTGICTNQIPIKSLIILCFLVIVIFVVVVIYMTRYFRRNSNKQMISHEVYLSGLMGSEHL